MGLQSSATRDDQWTSSQGSSRSFARHFQVEVGTTPYRWLLGQPIDVARRLLETSLLPVQQVAPRSGFNTVEAFRQQLMRWVGTSPRRYRAQFFSAAAPGS